MKPSGIAGWGMRPVFAKMPNIMVRIMAKMAAGILRSWDCAIELREMVSRNSLVGKLHT